MTVKRLLWPRIGNRDVHLLPGLVSPRLDDLLGIEDTDDVTWFARQPPDRVVVSFRGRFEGAPSAHGVTVDPFSGQVTVDPAWTATAPRLRSFIVEGEVLDLGPLGSPELARTFTTRIRVQVHEDITLLRLTPAVLTVRQDALSMRFSVLAQFDDGSTGDITNWCPVDLQAIARTTYVHAEGPPGPTPIPVLAWSPNSPDGSIGMDAAGGQHTGVLHCGRHDGAGATVTVRLSLPPSQAMEASARARCAKPWSTGVRLDHLAGPGFAAMGADGVRNVLVLPDGFEAADEAAFERCARRMVGRLSHRRRTRPFDLFKDTVNWFMAWLPSPQAGISVLTELDRVEEAAPGGAGGADERGAAGRAEPAAAGDARSVPAPSPPDPNTPATTPWSLRELIHEVGLPSPVLDPDGSELGTETEGRLHDWQALYGTHVTAYRAAGAFPEWLAMNDRVLLNEHNTAFHTGKGTRPEATGRLPGNVPVLHPLRLHEDDLDVFVNALQDDQGTPLGAPSVWARGQKDERLVVFLCRTNHRGGGNHGRYICASLGEDELHHLVEGDPTGFDVRVDPVTAEITAIVWLVVAHELGHSLTLADEYGGPRELARGEDGETAGTANAQPLNELDTGGGLDPGRIRWRWPRIDKAGVLAADTMPPASGGLLRLRLGPGQARRFRQGDVIRLRTRPLVGGVVAPVTSEELVVDHTEGDDVIAGALVADLADADLFPVGSVVMAPVRAPVAEGAAPAEELGLVSPIALERIEDTRNPLNAAWNAGEGRPCTLLPLDPTKPNPYRVPTPAANFEDNLPPRPPRWSVWIVGLYEQGNRYGCGVYRPSGICLMRLQLSEDEAAGFERALEFCAVCRYALVDLIDPSQHHVIERDYARRYPA